MKSKKKNTGVKKESKEMAVAKSDKATVKGVGFNLEAFSSEKGKKMIDLQRDSRRQRHIQSIKECEKFLEQFYDNFMEKKTEIKEKINMFLAASDEEIQGILAEMTDETLLANEIDYVNGTWSKIDIYFSARKEHLEQTLEEIKDLQEFQQKNSGKYWNRLQQELTDTAFLLEPAVIQLVTDWKNKEEERYLKEHEENYEFHKNLEAEEKQKYQDRHNEWEGRRIRFHILKQEHAIKTFQERIDSPEFVNPQFRIRLLERMKRNQVDVHKKRMNELKVLQNTETSILTTKKVEEIEAKIEKINEAAQGEYYQIAVEFSNFIKDHGNQMDSLLENLRQFLHRNKAQIDESTTYDKIIEIEAQPFVDRRKEEAKELYLNTYKYQEETDDKMVETCKNIVEFIKALATKYDKGKDDLKATDFQFIINLAK